MLLRSIFIPTKFFLAITVLISCSVNFNCNAASTEPEYVIEESYGVDWLVWVDDSNIISYSFTMYIPDDYSQTTDDYPVLIALHGGDTKPRSLGPYPLNELGGGPLYQLFDSNSNFYPDKRDSLHPDVKKAFVIYPVAHIDWNSATLNLMLDYLVNNYRINKKRIYITGGSYGGWATWTVTYENKRPDLHPAALVPLCGALNRYISNFNYMQNFENVAIWQFHSIDDGVVSYLDTNDALEALMPKGTNIMKNYPYSSDSDYTISYDDSTGLGSWQEGIVYPTGRITYTLLKHEGHGISVVDPNSDVWDWVFSQSR